MMKGSNICLLSVNVVVASVVGLPPAKLAMGSCIMILSSLGKNSRMEQRKKIGLSRERTKKYVVAKAISFSLL